MRIKFNYNKSVTDAGLIRQFENQMRKVEQSFVKDIENFYISENDMRKLLSTSMQKAFSFVTTAKNTVNPDLFQEFKEEVERAKPVTNYATFVSRINALAKMYDKGYLNLTYIFGSKQDHLNVQSLRTGLGVK